ncbi:MAG: hypothetical protein QOG20_896 [Pseudonocardiales bacterium]|jgi:hypothetical protein|nr:hypothetical protein [Pseudonocardiales bacterium]
MTEPGERVFTHLTAAQAEGVACVMCGRHYGLLDVTLYDPVGQSEAGSRVYACSGVCAELASMDD